MFALWQNLSLSVVQVAERNDGALAGSGWGEGQTGRGHKKNISHSF